MCMRSDTQEAIHGITIEGDSSKHIGFLKLHLIYTYTDSNHPSTCNRQAPSDWRCESMFDARSS